MSTATPLYAIGLIVLNELYSSIQREGFAVIIFSCHWEEPWWSHGWDKFFRVHLSRAETLIFNNE